ncbi:hypothetical protein TW95_gp0643 [Pandoravirus inopinatum]|uniref:Uncharacterized protein n=1 Tax=Pandoravirus inopinatum TaxID=1605721 RepID=A0A0B5JCL1_9VIRU|nr:hypothetical protein TW95_gp0643 [Pandoravirus inopinatum]AJF97377.1 hypothetical protein [Pandoravirus inopinatum]
MKKGGMVLCCPRIAGPASRALRPVGLASGPSASSAASILGPGDMGQSCATCFNVFFAMRRWPPFDPTASHTTFGAQTNPVDIELVLSKKKDIDHRLTTNQSWD